MTNHKKGAMSKTKNKGTAKNAVATTSSDVTTTETVVSSTNVVEESRQVTESEVRSSTTEVTSTGREIVMDSKGNVIKVIETSPQTVQQSTSSHKLGKSSQDFIAGEQTQSIKQAKTTRETPREDAKSLSESRIVRGESSDLVNQSVQMQSQSESRSTAQQSISSSSLIESSSTSEGHSGHRRSTVVDIRNGDHAPIIQTSSRATENTRASSETCEMVTKDGQTVSSRTRIRETGERIDDNGREISTSSREVDSDRTIAPSDVTVIKGVDDTLDKSWRGADSKSAKSNVEISNRCYKPGQSAWDGTFVYEKPVTSRGKNVDDKTVSVSSKVHGDSETSVKVTQETSATEEVIDQISTVTRDSKTVIDEGQLSATTRLRDIASEKIATDTTDFAGKERHSKGSVRSSKLGDSSWDGKFVVEKTTTQPIRRTTDSDVTTFRGDNVAETTERRDFREKSVDGTYEKESSESVRVVKGATADSRFISEERRDVSRESSTRIDDASPSGREGHPARVSSPSHRRIARLGDSTWNGEFVYEKTGQDDARKRSPADVTVVRRTEKHRDSVDVQDVTEEQNISNVAESVSASYIVEHAVSNDKKNVEKVTSVSEVILEEDAEEKTTRGPGSPEKQSKRDAGSRCYKPGQSTWDGTFVYERPQTPDSRRKPEDKRTVRTVDIRDVTGDNSINEADVTSTSYVVEHSSSQQSFSDIKDASLTSTIYETVVYEGRPVEMTIRFDKDSPRSQPSPSPHLTSPEKISKDRDLRSTKPGSSTWDGTFVLEKSPEKKRPPSRESTGSPSEKSRPVDSKGTSVDKSKKHISDTTIDLRNVTQDVSSTSEIVESSVIVEQSKMHETYTDSSNLDFSTSVETVIIRDGQPVTTQKTVTTIQEGSAKRPFVDDVKESTIKSPEKKKKEPRTDDRSYRPTKPGSSTWDGSFVYEKSEEKKKTPKDTRVEIDRRSPTKERPVEVTDHKTVTILDTSRDTTSADYSTSSTTVGQTFVTDSKTYDVSKTFIEERTEDKVHAIDHERPKQPIDEKPKPSPRQRPEDAKKPRDEEPKKSPMDRTYRPSKPGASTWDGFFVYEKPQEKPGDRKIAKETLEITDKRSPIKEKPSDVTDYRTSITILDTSRDVTSAADYSTSSTTIEQTFVTDSKTYDVSKTFIEENTEDKVHAIDHERPRQPIDEKPKPSPRQRPEDAKKPRDEEPRKSPDRTYRPSKPGASTWDGSFVYEKPQDSRKKPTSGEAIEKSPRKSPDEKPDSTRITRKEPDERTPRLDVTETRYVEDVTDITRTSEAVQRSSYVIDQSSSFTSEQDERVITEFTTDARKDVRDVTESTKEFINKEQVTSMVARDVVDDTRFDADTGPVPQSPASSTKKPSPERPGYPRGIPGLREDDRPKPIPAAGRPSRPSQREKSPQRPADHDRPSKVRPKSPEKLRDYTSPTRKPQPAAGKPSRPAEKSEKPTKPEQDHKPKRGDQIPDSLDEDADRPRSIPDILSKIPLKEQCICELCTCGRHRCPHNLPQEQFEFLYDEPIHTVTSYRQDYDEKHVEKQTKYYHEDHLHTEGEFIGQRRADYVATKGERAPVKKPQDHLKPEGEFVKRPKEEAPTRGERAPVRKPEASLKLEGDFDTTTTTELVFTGTPGERPIPIRRNTYTKIEGDFVDETTTRSQYIDHRSIQRAEIIKRTDNLTVGEGEFTGTSHIKEDFQTHVIEREPQWRPKYPEDIDRFYSKTDITDSITTTQEQYRTFDQADYKSTTVVKRADNLRPEGPFEALPHTKDDYITPILPRRPELQKPKDNLRSEGPFEGRPKDDYTPTRGERADVKRPEDNLRPEGPFEGRPKDDYSPKRGERPEVKRPEDNLRPEGPFEGRPKDDYRPTRGERADVKRPQDNLKPEGPFVGRPKDDYMPTRGERADVKRPEDNLRPEGPFEGRPKDDYKPTRGERADMKRPEDNLKPEGPFEGRPKDDYSPKRGERYEIKRPEDNLRPEGPFEGRPKDDYRPTKGERADVKRPQDNLKPEGPFIGRPKDDYTPTRGERADVKRPEDNLKPEGSFEGRPKDDYSPKRGERPEVKRPEDNLRPEGPFEGRPKDDYRPTKGERADVKRPKDNLRPKGDFVDRPKDQYTPGERRTPIKHPDNLYPEGDFERPEPIPYGPGDRASIVRHPDSLFPIGEFPDRKVEPFKPAERRTPIKYNDNLRPEGDFTGRPKDDYKPTRGERVDVKRPEDNLKSEGPFEGRPKDDYSPKRAERPEVKKPQDNLKPEGPFEGRPKDDYRPTKGERADVRRPEDNLRPEGPFEGRPKDDYSPKRAERPEMKRPEDNLRSEGDFERPEKKAPIGPAEKRSPIKHSDNLKPEGEFERPRPDGYRPAERPEVKKPIDNLKPEGDFERPRPEKYAPAEKRTPVKHPDNLKPEGEFVRTPKQDFTPTKGDRADVKRPEDNLRPEGPFEGRPKDDYRPVRGERMDIVKRTDNLRMEGDIETYRSRDEYIDFLVREKTEITKYQDNLRMEGEFIDMRTRDDFKVVKGERVDVVKHRDNLKPEGPFEGRPKDDFSPKKAERPEIKKPKDNLKPEGDFVRRLKEEAPKKGERADIKTPKDSLRPEGDFERPEKTPIGPAERRSPIKHTDNLKPEGEFERPKPEEFKPAEKPVVKKPHDNLKPEGEFISRPKEEAPKKGERADVKKPKDNLMPEGNFERPDKKPIGPAERRSPIKHPDNLKPEGEFERPKHEGYHPAERPQVKKPSDNLRPEGNFERPEKKPFGPVERRTPIKHADNLKPEGEFVGKPKEEVPKRGDRADVKKRPEDNLKPEGDFERPEKTPIKPAERRTPIKHPDNLRPEGEFEKRPKEKTPLKGERADVTKPKDNLRSEGEFERPQKSPIGPAERRTPIRHDDNLYPEGEFVGRPKDDFTPKRTDRPIQKKPKDNLKPEGEFVGKPKDDYKPTKGERTEIVIHRDNLKMEGDIDVYRSRDDYVTTSKRERVDIVHREDNLKIEGEFIDIQRRDDYRATRGERSEIIRHEDNLRSEGDFVCERPEKVPIGPAEKRSPIKHSDNLKPEGDFVQRPKEHAPTRGDRAIVKKPKDNLKSEGDFERPTKSPIAPAERRSPIKHPDNLYPEGEFVGRPKKDTPLKGDRADVKKPKDNLHLKGEFTKRTPKKVEPAERRTPIKHEDNLYPEGDFYMVPKDDFTPKRGDRSPVKKPQDNLRPEGEMEVSPKDDYKHVNGERVEVRRYEDHLRMEGQMDIHRSRDDYKKITKVEKVDVKRHEDNLRMEGEFIDVRRKDDYVHVIGERVPIKKHSDNLRSEGDFDRPQKTVVGPGERRSPIKHPDNLKSEGDFERRITDKIGPGERRSPIRHADNLKPEGDFIGRPRDDFTPKRTERIEVVKRKDNLKLTGDFEDTTSHRSTYKVVRGERADIKSHEDNLKISAGTMETKTTTKDAYTPSKPSPADKTVNRRKHMESSISLGNDTTVMTTTNRRNYNTYTKRTGKDIAAKMSQMESDARKTVESQTLTNGTVITTIKGTATSAQSDQRVANAHTVTQQQTQRVTDHRTTQPIEDSPSGPQLVDSRETVSSQHHEQHQRMHLGEQHLRSQNVAQTRRTIEDRSIAEELNHRGQIVRGEDTSRYAIDAGEHHRHQHQHVERHHQDMSKRDYVNTQHVESRQRSATRQQHEQHTISSQARYNSNSPEFRQTINGQTIVERSHVDSAKKIGHHRKNVISSSTDVSNAVLYRSGGVTTSTEALHTTSSTAADQRKSISNLAESGRYISNSSHSSDRHSLTSLHRSSKEVNPWASSSYERPQRIVRHDNLTVGGKFYSQSEAKSYGNFSQSSQKVERVQRQTNASHINLGDGSTVSSSMYKREYVPRHRGPCPATLLEAKQAPFKHTRDTQKHKFYMPVISN